MDIYIVVVERRADSARRSLWIHATDSRAAKINALRISGKSNFKVVTVELLADMVRVEVALPGKKTRKKRKTAKAKPAKRKSGVRGN